MANTWKQQNVFYKKYLYHLMQQYQSHSDLRAFTEVILSLSAVAMFGLLAIRPTVITIATLISDIREKERVIEVLDQKIQDLSQAQELYQQKSTVIALLDSSVPLEPAAQKYIRQLEALSADRGVSLNTLQSENIPVKGAVIETVGDTTLENEEPSVAFPADAQPIMFTVQVIGQFARVQSFLQGIESLRMPILLEVTNVGNSEDSGETVSAIIQGKIAFVERQQ